MPNGADDSAARVAGFLLTSEDHQGGCVVGAVPGWYADPSGGPGRKYWDGALWHDAVPARPGVPTASSGRSPLRVFLIAIAGSVLFFGGCAALAAVSDHDSDRHPSRSHTASSDGNTTLAPGLTLAPSEMRDAEFISAIIQAGIPVSDDRSRLLLVAHSACYYLDKPGSTMTTVVKILADGLPAWSPEQVGTFAALAVQSFCPGSAP